MAFYLRISYNSNERPWTNERYDALDDIKTREDAIAWAAYMQHHMMDYTISLFEDGKVIDFAEIEQASEESTSQPWQVDVYAFKQEVAHRRATRKHKD